MLNPVKVYLGRYGRHNNNCDSRNNGQTLYDTKSLASQNTCKINSYSLTFASQSITNVVMNCEGVFIREHRRRRPPSTTAGQLATRAVLSRRSLFAFKVNTVVDQRFAAPGPTAPGWRSATYRTHVVICVLTIQVSWFLSPLGQLDCFQKPPLADGDPQSQ